MTGRGKEPTNLNKRAFNEGEESGNLVTYFQSDGVVTC